MVALALEKLCDAGAAEALLFLIITGLGINSYLIYYVTYFTYALSLSC